MNKINTLEKLIKESIKKVPKDATLAISGGIDSSLLLALGKYRHTVTV